MMKISKLLNGVRIAFEYRKNAKLTTILIGIGRGTCNEPLHYSGISHLIEHLVSGRYPGSREIAQEFDRIGAEMDAATTCDTTTFYCTMPSRFSVWGFRLLANLVLFPKFTKDDVDYELGVVIEELLGYDDTVEERMAKYKDNIIFNGHDLRKPILGRPSVLKRMNYQSLMNYWDRLLDPKNIVIVVVGNFNREKMKKSIRQRFRYMKSPKNPILPREFVNPRPRTSHPFLRYEDLCQVNFLWNILLPGYRTRSRIALMLLSNILGGRFSSPLFLDLRDRGLIYDLDTKISFYQEIGYLTIRSASSRKKFENVPKIYLTLDSIRKTLNEYRLSGISQKEFELAQRSIRYHTLRYFENTESAARFYAEQFLAHSQIIDHKEFLEQMAKVTRRHLNKAANRFFRPKNYYFVGVGPFTRTDRQKINALF